MTSPTIDPTSFKSLQETAGADFVKELAGTFLEEAPRMLAALKGALAAGDAEKFRRNAHSLKSNGLTFGALAFAGIARELELGGLDRAKNSADGVPGLEAEYVRVAAALKAVRDA